MNTIPLGPKKPRLSSMHTHTPFCDGKDDVETMCRTAAEKQLCAIGFSAHAPIYKKTGIKTDWHMSEDRLDEYISEVFAARSRWHGKLDVFLGFEVDYIKGLRSAMDSDIKAIKPDFIIGSVHYLVPANGAEPFTVDGPMEEFENGFKNGFGGNGEALMHSYYDAMAEMIAIGGFDILGHADIVKKNCLEKTFWNAENEAIRQEETARIIAASGLVTEINTGGLNRGKIRETYPSISFVSRLRKFEIPVIITADAHCANHLDGYYNIALQTLAAAGYSEHLLFSGKNNEKAVWSKEFIQKIKI